MNISKVTVANLNESIKASGYPMCIEIDDTETPKDFERAVRLGRASNGSGHSNYLKGIIVQADLTCSQAMHMQMLRYNFIDIVSSQSKMHRLTRMDVSKQCNKYVKSSVIVLLEKLIKEYNKEKTLDNYLKVIYNCPVGLELTFRFSTNYLQLKTIHTQRKNHKLPEWQEFCKWIETLPYCKELTGI